MKKLVIKKGDRTYTIDDYDIRKKEDYTVISGYDFEGMYFQMKYKGKYKVQETEATKFIYLK